MRRSNHFIMYAYGPVGREIKQEREWDITSSGMDLHHKRPTLALFSFSRSSFLPLKCKNKNKSVSSCEQKRVVKGMRTEIQYDAFNIRSRRQINRLLPI
jgi:hypothetical protein